MRTFFALFLFSTTLKAFAQPSDTLSFLSWNTYLLPKMFFWTNQKERAEQIILNMQQEDYDVVVFQEMFDVQIANKVKGRLFEKYPFQFGPGKGGFLRLNSGVVILSKYPFEQSYLTKFHNCKGPDCRAKKSAIMVTLVKEEKRIQIVGTHLQSTDGYIYSKIRKNQLHLIKRMADQYRQKNVPIVYLGDFNVKKNSSYYGEMLTILSAKDGEITSDLKYGTDPENDLCWSGKPKILDYILIDSNQTNAQVIQREFVRYTCDMRKGGCDLSDHYAIKAKVIF